MWKLLFAASLLIVFKPALGYSPTPPDPDPTLYELYQKLERDDYIVPEPVHQPSAARWERQYAPLQASQSQSPLVTYTAFDGSKHLLEEFRGRYVRVLAPPDWERSEGMTPDEIRMLVDHADILYAHFVEVLQREPCERPGREGLLTIAFIPSENMGGALGLGARGCKGVQYLSDNYIWAIKDSLKAGVLPSGIIHEITHNFDFVSGNFNYLREFDQWGPGHAYTTFMQNYITWYSRMFFERWGKLIPSDFAFRSANETYWRYPYLKALNEGKQVSWELCLLYAGCSVEPYRLWGGFWLNIAAYHPDRIPAIFRSLADQKSTLDVDDPNREILGLRAFQNNFHEPIGCYLQQLNWFGRDLPDFSWGYEATACQDNDYDTQSAIRGDCNDADQEVSSNHSENAGDRKDNNCRDGADEVTLAEQADFGRNVGITLPAVIHGRITDRNDYDGFDVVLNEPSYVSIEACSEEIEDGGLWVMQPEPWQSLASEWIKKGSCAVTGLKLPARVKRNILVGMTSRESSKPGAYVLKIQAHRPLEIDNMATLEPAVWQEKSQTWRLRADLRDLPAGDGMRLRFWVVGYGWAGEMPVIGDQVTLDWRAPTGWGRPTYRVQLLKDGKPLTYVSTLSP